eukprot:3349648-Pyramimonas_sp.AAC.2
MPNATATQLTPNSANQSALHGIFSGRAGGDTRRSKSFKTRWGSAWVVDMPLNRLKMHLARQGGALDA